MKKTLFVTLLLVLVVALGATEEGGAEAHHFDWIAFWGRVLNFVILFGGLILLVRKPLIAMLARRSEEVRYDIEHRQDKTNSAECELERLTRRLDQLEKEIAVLQEEARRSGEAERAVLEESGRRESERVLAQSEVEIERRVELAMRRMKEHIADLTIARFTQDFREKSDADVQQRFIEKNIRMSGDIVERK